MLVVPARNEVIMTFLFPLTSPHSTCACTKHPKDTPYGPGVPLVLETKPVYFDLYFRTRVLGQIYRLQTPSFSVWLVFSFS